MKAKRFWNTKDPSIKLKICNIRTINVAYEVTQIGADALGFHIWKNSDIEERTVRFGQIIRFLPKDVSCWLLTDVTDPLILKRILVKANFDTVQLQGMTSVNKFLNFIKRLEYLRNKKGVKIVKTISMSSRNYKKISIVVDNYSKYVDAILLDSKWKGGTGMIHNWDWSAEIVRTIPKPVILAGGLTPINVTDAITKVKPYGVDVESGVEVVIGYYRGKRITCKSFNKIKNFIENVKKTHINYL